MKLKILLFAILFSFSLKAHSQTYAINWSVSGLTHSSAGLTFTTLSLDLELLERFFDVNGTLHSAVSYRPVNGTCLLEELTNTVICVLRMDATTLTLTLNPDTLNGTVILNYTETATEIGRGIITFTSIG